MRKAILCAFIAISTLISCSSDSDEQYTEDKSFSFKIIETKTYYNNAGTWEEITNSALYTTDDSRLYYEKKTKLLTYEFSKGYYTQSPVTFENGKFVSIYMNLNIGLISKHTYERKKGYIECLEYSNDELLYKYIYRTR
ncbi:hypothetical protein [Flavobacterium hydrophilum]|uniref:Uncharacterized protein n=1 Tax=Flavobacterium hydrophilum TaxID=2211445 RepID=A0A2V4BXT4_9FLAO|nr:hypothetical protein [Flavobacterium hydrophilum]PXY43811.1 hypothetical protein DMB68_19730 [Flavobacterium hydrophilum]